MPSLTLFSRSAGALALTIGLIPAAAAAQGSPDTRILVESFRETCLAGAAAGLESTRLSAIAAGWSPQSARVISTATGQRLGQADAPIFLRRGDLTLALTPQGAEPFVCSVSASLNATLTTSALAELVSGELRAGEPVIQPSGRGKRAFWRIEGRIQVEASVTRNNSLRNAKLVMRLAEPQLALRD